MEWLVRMAIRSGKRSTRLPAQGWDQYDCVASVRRPGRLAAASTTSAPLNPVLDAMKSMLGN
jgi:hypothetical protein